MLKKPGGKNRTPNVAADQALHPTPLSVSGRA
jgi:hypothetical protein